MNTRLEHANLTVRDMEAMLSFIRSAFPEFRVRHDSGETDPERWLHVGDDDTYLALSVATQPADADGRLAYSDTPGFNHLGFVVEDVEGVRQRLLGAGFRESTYPNSHPARRRVYFYDAEGNDWEFVQYFSEDRERRNDYRG